MQLYFRINDLQDPPWDYEAVNTLLDLGDFVQAEASCSAPARAR